MKAIVTGSFDPLTLGHIEIIKFACEHYEKVYVVALINPKKNYMFSMEEKKAMMELSLSEYKNVVIDTYKGLTADYMHKNEINYIIRGIRNEADVEYEKKLSQCMKKYDQRFETIMVKSKIEYQNVSSTAVREKILNGESLEGVLHPSVIEYLKKSKKI